MLDDVLGERVGRHIVLGRQSRSRSRGRNHMSTPLREQIEQLHAVTPVKSPSASKAILPQ
jgi:hypothetical protein